MDAALIDGEGWAFQQIADRLEGKPVQQIEAMIDDRKDINAESKQMQFNRCVASKGIPL